MVMYPGWSARDNYGKRKKNKVRELTFMWNIYMNIQDGMPGGPQMEGKLLASLSRTPLGLVLTPSAPLIPPQPRLKYYLLVIVKLNPSLSTTGAGYRHLLQIESVGAELIPRLSSFHQFFSYQIVIGQIAGLRARVPVRRTASRLIGPGSLSVPPGLCYWLSLFHDQCSFQGIF